MSDERPTKESPPAAFCSESVATIDTVKRPYCPRNPCAFFAALQGKRCAMVNHRGVGGNGLWHCRESSHAIHRPENCDGTRDDRKQPNTPRGPPRWIVPNKTPECLAASGK